MWSGGYSDAGTTYSEGRSIPTRGRNTSFSASASLTASECLILFYFNIEIVFLFNLEYLQQRQH